MKELLAYAGIVSVVVGCAMFSIALGCVVGGLFFIAMAVCLHMDQMKDEDRKTVERIVDKGVQLSKERERR